MTGEAALLPVDVDQPTAAMRQLRQQLFDAYRQLAREWVDGVNDEVGLWGALNARLANAEDMPEALAACEDMINQRMTLAAGTRHRPIAGSALSGSAFNRAQGDDAYTTAA